MSIFLAELSDPPDLRRLLKSPSSAPRSRRGREGGTQGGGRKREREGGREEEREGGRERGRKEGRKRERELGRQGGREGGRRERKEQKKRQYYYFMTGYMGCFSISVCTIIHLLHRLSTQIERAKEREFGA